MKSHASPPEPSPAQRLNLAEKEVAAARNAADPRELGLALARCARIWEEGRAFRRARALFEESLILLRTQDDERALAEALSCSVDSLAECGEMELAEQRALEAVTLLRSGEDKSSLGGAKQNLANVLIRQERYPEALVLLADALQIRLALGDKALAASMSLIMAGVLSRMGQAEAATESLVEARDLARRGGVGPLAELASRLLKEGLGDDYPRGRYEPALR